MIEDSWYRLLRVVGLLGVWRVTLVCGILLGGIPSTAAALSVETLLRSEADLFVDGGGLVRLPIPPEVLTACAGDLSDLRVFDHANREVPYFIDSGIPVGWEAQAHRLLDAQVLDVFREELEREERRPLSREIYRLRVPAEILATDSSGAGDRPGAWSLQVNSSRNRFVRSLSVQAERDDGKLDPLVSRASVARLGQSTVDRNEILLPRFLAPVLVVSIEGEDGTYLEPTFRFVRRRGLPSQDAMEIPLEILDSKSVGKITVLELMRPPGLIPLRLHLTTSTPAAARTWVVFDVEPSGAIMKIGEGRIVKASGLGGVDELEVDISAPHGVKLRVEIHDRESPPLADLALRAMIRQPMLVFSLAPRTDGRAGLLRYGGGRAWRASYDLERLFQELQGEASQKIEQFSRLPLARLGESRLNPSFDERPALWAALRPGPVLERNHWRWHRTIHVPDSPEGVVKLKLGAEDMAWAEPDGRDLRIVDAAGQQWPFLVGTRSARETKALRVEPTGKEKGETFWRLQLPVATLVVADLSIVPTRPILRRGYRLLLRSRQAEERELARGMLIQDLQRPSPIHLTFQATRLEAGDELILAVADGDDAPVELEKVELSLIVPELLLASPAGELVLLAGNPDAEAPAYELARARDLVVGLRSGSAALGVGQENSNWDGVPGGSARTKDRLQRTVVWATLGIAVFVLGLLTLRMTKREG